MFTLSLEIVNSCNLNCKYCYLGEKTNVFMPFDIGMKAIDIAVHEAKKQYDKTLCIYYIGGEPLLAFKLIRQLTDYTDKLCQKNGLTALFSTTTNGTLMTKEIIEYFILYKFELKISLDGREAVHNKNRIDYSGKGSYSDVFEKMDMLKTFENKTGNYISIVNVVTQNTHADMLDSFKYIYSLGFTRIETAMDNYCTWTDEEKIEVAKGIKEIFFYIRDEILPMEPYFFWNPFVNYLTSYVKDVIYYPCRAGMCSLYITGDGNIFTCLGVPEFNIGNVWSGLEVSRIRQIVYLEEEMPENCTSCEFVKHCKIRSCLMNNFVVNGDRGKPVDLECFIAQTFYGIIKNNFTEKQLDAFRESIKKGS